jgi:hypothetical protein
MGWEWGGSGVGVGERWSKLRIGEGGGGYINKLVWKKRQKKTEKKRKRIYKKR